MTRTAPITVWALLAMALAALCSASACDDEEASSDAGAAGHDGGDAGSPDAAGGTGDAGPGSLCTLAVTESVTTIEDAQGPASPSMLAWTGDGFVGAWPEAVGGYRVLELDAQGRARVAARTLWQDSRAAEAATIAVSGDVLALVDQALDASTQRPICRLALAHLGGGASIQVPTRISDPPESESVLNEVQHCTVVSVGDAFLAVWQQQVSRTDLAVSSFGQWFERDGKPRGSRLTLEEADGTKRGPISIAADGTRAVLARMGGKAGAPSLLFVEGDQLRPVPLALGDRATGSLAIQAAHDGFIALSGDALWVLDRNGRRAHGPVTVAARSLVAPLGEGYVAVSHDEYLVARSWSAELAGPSSPVGISTDRGAVASALVHAPDGSATAVLFSEGGKLRFAPLACGGEQPPPPGPGTCPMQQPLRPLDDECDEAVCHVVIRLDYLTLGVLGWTSLGGAEDPVDAEGALQAAQEVFDTNSEYVSEAEISGPAGGLFLAFASPSDFGAFALIGRDSGRVVAAGGVVWSGRGSYWVPSKWNPAGDLACGDDPVSPAEQSVPDAPEPCTVSEDMHPPSALDALEVALRSNLAAHVAAQGPFSARVYLYTPTVGACDPGAAEYLAVLTQLR